METLILSWYYNRYYLHTPYATQNTYIEAHVAKEWELLESLQRSGKVCAIGVSNFRKHHIENLLKTAKIKPVINQIQFNPYVGGAPQYAKWLQSKGIAVASYMGLAPITWLKEKHLEESLNNLAKKYDTSKSTILIRWQLDQGVIVINTTKKVERMREYFDALNLTLAQEDADQITSIGQTSHLRIPIFALYDGNELGPYEY